MTVTWVIFSIPTHVPTSFCSKLAGDVGLLELLQVSGCDEFFDGYIIMLRSLSLHGLMDDWVQSDVIAWANVKVFYCSKTRPGRYTHR